jgi:predicted nucleotidyltransferase
MSKEEIKKYLTEYLKKKGVLKASIFGSLARGESSSASDIDILVKLDKNKTLLDLIGLKLELEELLNQKVDVLTYNSLHPLLRENILKDEEVLYGK